MTILEVKMLKDDKMAITWPQNHPKSKRIEEWLKNLSPGYVEYLLQFGKDPHCSACRDTTCENVGMGDDAESCFKFGEDW